MRCRFAGWEKKWSCVTTRRRKLWIVTGLGLSLGTLTARTLSLGVLGFDLGVLATLGLPPRRLPAADFPLALRVLTVALVPRPRTVLAPASFAQTDPGPRSAPSGRTTVLSLNLRGAHGRLDLPRGSSGRMLAHPPRAVSIREPNAGLPVYRLLENQTESETV
jgi:hypothetical protein